MTILAYITCLLLSIRLLVTLINAVSKLHLPEPCNLPDEFLISILIPTRNEEQNILHLLNDIEKQNYRNFEVLIYDDCSQDKTVEKVQSFINGIKQYRLIQGNKLPEGWLGKNYACHNLALAAKGEYILFLDADVRIQGNLISCAIEFLKNNGLQLFSIFPRQLMLSTGEKLTVSLMHLILLSMLPMILIRRLRNPAFAAANGQFMLFSTKTYKQSQWHAKFRKEKVEDIAIQRAIKRQKGKVDTLLGDQRIQCQMYHTFSEGIKGFAKNLPAFFGDSFISSGLYLIITYIGFIFVILQLPWIFWSVYCLAALFIHLLIAYMGRQSISDSILLLVPRTLVFVIVYFYALYSKLANKMIWKGRKI